MESRSDRILYGEIPIEMDTAHRHSKQIKVGRI